MKATQLTTTAFKDERLNQLNSWQEALYHRILIAVGDGDELVGDAQFISGFLFPLKVSVRAAQVDSALHALADANLIGLGVKPDNRPYLWVVMPEAPDSLGRGGGSGGGDGDYLNNKYYGNNEEHTGNVRDNEATGKHNLGIADEFGVTDSEASSNREVLERLDEEARRSGLKTTVNALNFAVGLVEQYGLDDVLKAIRMSFDRPTWKYVEGILRTAKARGVAVDAPKPSSRKWYTGDDDEAQDDGWGGVLQVGDF